ncbi:MAG: hotdog domain-containing protein [Defluviimonas denitrificans]
MDIHAPGWLPVNEAQGRVTTVAVDAMKFITPVKVGDVLCIYVEVTRVGRTSMALRDRGLGQARPYRRPREGAEATFTFVAIDDAGRPARSPIAP